MAQGDTKNVGTIAALWVAATAPTNTKLIWYDTANSTHRTYNTSTGQWDALTPQSVTNTTLSALTTAAQSGLPIGKFYYLTDIGTLAIAITQTKIWYVDVHSNYVVNDLVASIQSYVNSTNLLIDGVTGVWDAENGRLLFNFTEQTTPASLNKDKDYILMHRNNSGVMSWVKTKLANLISNVSGNSISWNNGLFFSASAYIGSVKDESGGVVGYDSYLIQIASIEAEIDNLAADNNAVRQDAYNYTDSKVTPNQIYDKQLPSAITPSGSPSQPVVGWTLKSILNDIYGWVNKFKYGNNISIGANFNTNGVPGDVNQSDNITNAFQKVVYKLKKLLISDGIKLPNPYNVPSGDVYPAAEDTITTAIGKLDRQVRNLHNASNVKLPDDYDWADWDGDGYPAAEDTSTAAIGKLDAIIHYLSKWSDKLFIKDGSGTMSDYGSRQNISYGDTIFDAFRKLLYRVTHITNDDLNNYIVNADKISKYGVAPTDILRVDYDINMNAEYAVGLCLNEGSDGMFSMDDSYPWNPYRVAIRSYSSNPPVILGFVPVIFNPLYLMGSKYYAANASAILNRGGRTACNLQIMVTFSAAGLAALAAAGKTTFNVSWELDIYGYIRNGSSEGIPVRQTSIFKISLPQDNMTSTTYNHIILFWHITV